MICRSKSAVVVIVFATVSLLASAAQPPAENRIIKPAHSGFIAGGALMFSQGISWAMGSRAITKMQQAAHRASEQDESASLEPRVEFAKKAFLAGAALCIANIGYVRMQKVVKSYQDLPVREKIDWCREAGRNLLCIGTAGLITCGALSTIMMVIMPADDGTVGYGFADEWQHLIARDYKALWGSNIAFAVSGIAACAGWGIKKHGERLSRESQEGSLLQNESESVELGVIMPEDEPGYVAPDVIVQETEGLNTGQA